MKFSINKNTLLKNLQLLSKATPSRSTLPIISSALFMTEENKLSMRATDLEISINIKCDIIGGEEGCIAIPLGKLLVFRTKKIIMKENEKNQNVKTETPSLDTKKSINMVYLHMEKRGVCSVRYNNEYIWSTHPNRVIIATVQTSANQAGRPPVISKEEHVLKPGKDSEINLGCTGFDGGAGSHDIKYSRTIITARWA